MARHLNVFAFAFLLATAAAAEALPDPTRPPPGFGSGTAGEEVDSGPRLQSVVIPRSGRPTAVISGRTVRLGDKVGDGRLVRLTETEAVIEGPAGMQRLLLTPEVQKTPAAQKKPSAKPKERP